MTSPSAMPLSVTRTIHPRGNCKYPACRSSFLDSGVNAEVFSNERERGSVSDRGRMSDTTWESVGHGGEVEVCELGEGKHVRVRDRGKIGGLRDCLRQEIEHRLVIMGST